MGRKAMDDGHGGTPDKGPGYPSEKLFGRLIPWSEADTVGQSLL
jgi:hypothetical protein